MWWMQSANCDWSMQIRKSDSHGYSDVLNDLGFMLYTNTYIYISSLAFFIDSCTKLVSISFDCCFFLLCCAVYFVLFIPSTIPRFIFCVPSLLVQSSFPLCFVLDYKMIIKSMNDLWLFVAHACQISFKWHLRNVESIKVDSSIARNSPICT